jgi:3-dehydroquinate synthase
MKSISAGNCNIVFNEEGYDTINQYLNQNKFSKIFVIVDENTARFCLPLFLDNFSFKIKPQIIKIKAGENYKNIKTCSTIWDILSESGADRKSLILNLGGGVITDLGGFVACTFKRGIKYINIPTSLLAMVDASVGGKTGVDLGSLKNQIGVINSGDLVLIDTKFLDTLPTNQFNSGISEMLKHGLITSDAYWLKMVKYLEDKKNLDELIYESIQIKAKVVEKDPMENGLRKTLNYGHTIGHAIESYFLQNSSKKDLLHGEAIAIGMILTTYISFKKLGFPETKMNNIKKSILEVFMKISFNSSDLKKIIDLLKFDKKNYYGEINFVLLEDIGIPKLDCQVENDLILDAFKFYSN